MEEEVKQLLQQLMFGTYLQQDRAYDELRAMGIPATKLEEIRQKGAFKKEALQAAPPDNSRVIQAEPIPEPYFTWRERKAREQTCPIRQKYPFNASRQDYQPRSNPPVHTSHSFGEKVRSYVGENYLQLSALGMDVAMMGGDYKLHINNFNLMKKAVKNGKFVADWNGHQVWSLKFYGNAYVPKEVVAAEKAAFQSTFKTLKLIKFAGSLATGISFSMSGYDLLMEDTIHERAKAVLDVLMTGVAFFPGYGWAISGIYFLYTGSLTLHDDDWWEIFWKNYLTDPQHFAEEMIRAFDEADQAHRRITGRGLLQGSKF